MNTLQSSPVARAKLRAPSRGILSLTPNVATQLSRAALALPLAGVALGASLLGASSAARRRFGLTALGISAGAVLARWQLGRAFTWQPPYEVEFEYGRLEIRRYDHQIHAETSVEHAAWDETLNEGFRRLAAYIFGDNEARQRLPMTSPVMTTVTLGSGPRRSVKSWKPPSVAPLGQLNAETSRNMVFVMPGDMTLDELPTPNDERIHLHGVAPRRVAVLAFRGRYGGDLPAQKRNELLFLLKCAGLKAASEVWLAGYDGPSTLGFLRRNEVLVEISE
jgi:hypothetical protein